MTGEREKMIYIYIQSLISNQKISQHIAYFLIIHAETKSIPTKNALLEIFAAIRLIRVYNAFHI